VLRSVIFSPEDLSLVRGDPSVRRKFLDETAVMLQPTRLGLFSDYDRVVKQRTTLLKTAKYAQGSLSTLDIWDEKLAQLGAEIVSIRMDVIRHLQPHVQRIYQEIAPGEGDIKLFYKPQVEEIQ